jgi:hypothetical protein
MIPLFTWLIRPETVLTPLQRAVGMHVIGVPQTGKSSALEDWAWQDIVAGRGVCVIDPAGDLFANLLARVAAHPEMHQRVIVLDPTDEESPVRINPLLLMPGVHPERHANFLTDIVMAAYKLDVASYPRMVPVAQNSFALMSYLGLPLTELPTLLLNYKVREQLLPLLPDELAHVRTFFTVDFPKTPGGAKQWYLPLANKLERLLFDRGVRRMLTGSPMLDFRAILDAGKVLLVNVPNGILGDDTSALFAAFVVAMFQKAALSRVDTYNRPPYLLYLDEFQRYTTSNIQDILSEARKYGLSLVLAHQYLNQLSDSLKSAVLSTVGSTVCFRVGPEDASALSPGIFRRGDIGTDPPALQHLERGGRIPFLRFQERFSQPNWDRAVQALVNQPNRRMHFRKKGNFQPVQLRSRTIVPIKLTPEIQEAMARIRQQVDPACVVHVEPVEIPKVAAEAPKKRGRPPKQKDETKSEPKKRGRPPKPKLE